VSMTVHLIFAGASGLRRMICGGDVCGRWEQAGSVRLA
jgi:hypothetical protein